MHPQQGRPATEPILTRRSLLTGTAAVSTLGLAACTTATRQVAKPAPTIALPVFQAWVQGRAVRYISTDASDQAFAQRMGINHAPRLSASLPAAGDRSQARPSVLERVYMFHDEVQINVFQSAPDPVGPDSRDAAYSPLWRAVMVRWLSLAHRQELRSEEDILAAEDRAWISTELTSIVINCPIVAPA